MYIAFLITCFNNILSNYIGFTGQDDLTKLKNLRIFGVLQRLAMCYFFTAIIVLVLDKNINQSDAERSSNRNIYYTM